MNDCMQYLMELIPERDSLKLVKTEAKKYYQSHSLDECYAMGLRFKEDKSSI